MIKDTQNTSRNRFQVILKSWAAPFGCGLLLLLLLKYAFFVGYVPSASMEPTIRRGSFIFGVRCVGELELGDIVVFEHDNLFIMKRIAALPGDDILVNGVNLTVPVSFYFMLGDNPDESIDSRYWNDPFIPRTRIIAKVQKNQCDTVFKRFQ